MSKTQVETCKHGVLKDSIWKCQDCHEEIFTKASSNQPAREYTEYDSAGYPHKVKDRAQPDREKEPRKP